MENMNYGETEVLDSNYTPNANAQYANPQYTNQQYTTQQYANPQFVNQQYMNQQYTNPQSVRPNNFAPALQLPTNRSLVKMIFLSLITFGIYGMVIWCKIVTEINITASRYDGKRTCPYFATLWLSTITYGIFAFVWQHNFSNRVGAEVRRRGYDYKFSATDFWLWCILGSLIIVGPFIYCHKLMKCMNMINESYNVYG